MFKTLLIGLLLSLSTLAEARFSYSASGTSGKMNFNNGRSESYSEIEAAFTYWYRENLGVELSGLTRIVEHHRTYYGAAVAFPLSLNLGQGGFGLISHITPGYRIMRSYHAPFLGGGVSFKIASSRLGIGYRVIFNEATGNDIQNESQLYFSYKIGVF